MLYLQDKNIAGIVQKKDLNERSAPDELVKDTIYPENWISAAARNRIGGELYKIHPKAMSTTRIREFAQPDYLNRRKMILHYETQDGSRVVLRGTDENRDSIYVVLDRYERPYALSRSSLEAGAY
jgi:hypothetical protein